MGTRALRVTWLTLPRTPPHSTTPALEGWTARTIGTPIKEGRQIWLGQGEGRVPQAEIASHLCPGKLCLLASEFQSTSRSSRP